MQKMQAGTAGSPRTDAALAEQVNALIKQRLGEPLTLKTLASVLAVSPFHLQRLYKRFTGRSPAAQLQKARIEAAKKMLAEESPSIADIGAAVGFRSPSHFAVWFRRETGLSPKEYRELPQEDKAGFCGE